MSATLAVEEELRHVYGRYKALALGAGAALLLGPSTRGALFEDVARLERDAELAQARTTGESAASFAAAREATAELRLLVRDSVRGPAGVPDERLDAVRETHRRLRRRLWPLIYRDYRPCSARDHGHER